MRLQIGAVGFEHPKWRGSFYPDDLPDDWRLQYYANEFSSVLLPAGRLLGAADDEIEEWADDLEDDFEIMVRCPAQTLPALAESLGGHLAPIAGHVRAIVADSPIPAAENDAARLPPFTVVRQCWTFEQPPPLTDALAVGIVQDRAHDLRALRALLEVFINWSGTRDEAWLFFDDGAPEMMADARVIADLLLG